MASFYDINFNNRVVELLPPDKRYQRLVAWLQAMIKPLQNLHSQLFVDYKVGADYPIWGIGSYSLGDRVIYGQSVYESLTDANTAYPTDQTKWKLYQLYFLGVDDRIKYNGVSLVLNYAINDRFNTNYRQPPLQSDIYFSVNEPVSTVFIVGGDEINSSAIYYSGSNEQIINAYDFNSFYNLVIHFPNSVYVQLSTDPIARENIVRDFVSKILHAGIKFTIQTY